MKSTIRGLIRKAAYYFPDALPVECRLPDNSRVSPRGQQVYGLLIDASPSMDEPDYPPSRFAAAKEAAVRFLEQSAEQNPTSLVGVVFYAAMPHVRCHPLPVKQNLDRLRDAVQAGEISAATNTGEGLLTAGEEVLSQGSVISPAIILLTDGHANVGPDPVPVSAQLKRLGIRIDIVGIGGSPADVNEPELRQMASVVNGQLRYWFIRDSISLVRRFEALALGKIN